jgi:hypothetical protein
MTDNIGPTSILCQENIDRYVNGSLSTCSMLLVEQINKTVRVRVSFVRQREEMLDKNDHSFVLLLIKLDENTNRKQNRLILRWTQNGRNSFHRRRRRRLSVVVIDCHVRLSVQRKTRSSRVTLPSDNESSTMRIISFAIDRFYERTRAFLSCKKNVQDSTFSDRCVFVVDENETRMSHAVVLTRVTSKRLLSSHVSHKPFNQRTRVHR